LPAECRYWQTTSSKNLRVRIAARITLAGDAGPRVKADRFERQSGSSICRM